MERPLYILITIFLLNPYLFSQTFIDDFESYTPGSFLALSSTNWDTWNNTPGGTDDVQITTTNANSGSNSIYFSSIVPNGGPEDIVLRFPSAYTNGQLELETNISVELGKGGHFYIFQTWSTSSGQVFAVHLRNDGTVLVYGGSSQSLEIFTNYPIDQWFNFRVKMDLDNNVWEVFIDNVSQGAFISHVGSVGMLDFYPYNPISLSGNDISGFYVDDVSYTYSGSTMISEPKESPKIFNLFPNPSKGKFFIEIKEHYPNPFFLIITDISGKLLWQEAYEPHNNKKVSFPAGFLPKGVYLVSLESNGNINHKKLVIQ